MWTIKSAVATLLYRIAAQNLGSPLDSHFRANPPTLPFRTRIKALLPFGGFEAHEDQDFDYVCFVILDMLVGCADQPRLNIVGGRFHP